MADNKKILVNIQANTRQFRAELSKLNTQIRNISKTASDTNARILKGFGQTQTAIRGVIGAITPMTAVLRQVSTATRTAADNSKRLADNIKPMSNTMRAIRTNTANSVTALNSLHKTMSDLRSDIAQLTKAIDGYNKGITSAVKSSHSASAAMSSVATSATSAATSITAASTASRSSSWVPRNIYDARMAYRDLTRSAQEARNALSFGNIPSPLPVFEAWAWDTAYSIQRIPGQIFQGIKQQIDDASALEGELYDLEAYLGGPGGKELIEFGRQMGAVGSEEQIKTQGLNILQNKILEIGQRTPFTAREIAQATTAAAKAGVTISEIAGSTGTALDAIALLSQNTGESLESSATQVSKLQALFETSLAKTQEQMGKTADAAAQYQIIVDGLATADMSSASSASELTQALFNVGGSAQNLNMSFFDTVSLVSSMVPAFESAASAGTSLKYVFSALSGGRSVKASAAMKQLGLMDEYGQSVFFDSKGFKGLEFMTRALRETFGDASGMAVDVRNRIITDIFGQDALKAISRLVSMSEEQTTEMLQMSVDLAENARQGVQAAADVAAIKNEGLEFDVEYMKGSMDSLLKTLTMPTLGPMSNIVQTFSGFMNGAFAEIQRMPGFISDIQETRKELIESSMIPGADKLFDAVIAYSKNIGEAFRSIGKEGLNFTTAARALASLFGGGDAVTIENTVAIRGALQDLFKFVSEIIPKIPEYLKMFRDASVWFASNLTNAFRWIHDNWDSIITGLKVFIALLVVERVASFAFALWSMANSMSLIAQNAGGLRGVLQNLPDIVQPQSGIGQLLTHGVSSMAGGAGPGAKVASTVATTAGSATGAAGGAAAGHGIAAMIARLVAGWGALVGAVKAGAAALMAYLGGLMTAIGGFIAAFAVPIAIALAAIAAFAIVWNKNVNGIQEYTKNAFSGIGEFLSTTFGRYGEIFSNMWNALMSVFRSIGNAFQYTWDGISKIYAEWDISNHVIFSSLSDLFKGVIGVVAGLIKFLIGGIGFLANTILWILQGGKAATDNMADSAAMVIEGLANVASGIIQLLSGALKAIASTVTLAFDNLLNMANAFWKTITGRNLTDFSFSESVNEELTKMAKGADSYLQNWAKNAGGYVREGFKDGVLEKGSFKEPIALAALEANEAAKDTFETRSPSRVFYEIGLNIMQGLTMGVEEGSKMWLDVLNKRFGEGVFIAEKVTTLFKNVQDSYSTKMIARIERLMELGYSQEEATERVRNTVGAAIAETIAKGLEAQGGPGLLSAKATPITEFFKQYKTNDIRDMYSAEARDYYVAEGQTLYSQRGVVNPPITGQPTVDKIIVDSLTDVFYKAGSGMFNKDLYNQAFALGVTPEQQVELLRQAQEAPYRTPLERGRPLSNNIFGYTVDPIKVAGPLYDNVSPLVNVQVTDILPTGQYGGGRLNQGLYEMAGRLGYGSGDTINMREFNDYIKSNNRFAGADKRDEEGNVIKQDWGQVITDKDGNVLKNPTYIPGAQITTAIYDYSKDLNKTIRESEIKKVNDLYNAEISALAREAKKYNQDEINYKKKLNDLAAKGLTNTHDYTNALNLASEAQEKYEEAMSRYHAKVLERDNQIREVTKLYGPDYKLIGETTTSSMGTWVEGTGMVSSSTQVGQRLLTPEEVNAANPDQAYAPVVQIPQAFTFDQIPNLSGYSTETTDVNRLAQGFMYTYGAAGIEQRGLTEMFEDEKISSTYAQIGTRAATFLSMKKGVLSPEDEKTFLDLYRKDVADKKRYLDAVAVAKNEIQGYQADKSLNPKQLVQKAQASLNKLDKVGQPLTTGYTDIYNVKVGGFSDYQSGAVGVPDAYKQYTDPLMGSYATEIDKALAESEKFQKLSPAKQKKIREQLMQMPLQSMAYLTDALMDGVLDEFELDQAWVRMGQDLKLGRQIAAEGREVTEADRSMAYTPYAEGAATFTKRENITGILGPSFLDSWDNLVANYGQSNGQVYWRNFLSGIDSEGRSTGAITLEQIFAFDPATVQKIGQDLVLGIVKGVNDGASMGDISDAAENVTNTALDETTDSAGIESPSRLFAEKVGKPIVQGIALGITENTGLILPAVQGLFSNLNVAAKNIAGKDIQMNVFQKTGNDSAKRFVDGFTGVGMAKERTLSGRLGAEILKLFATEQSSGDVDFIKVVENAVYAFGSHLANMYHDGFKASIQGVNESNTTVPSMIKEQLNNAKNGDVQDSAKSVGAYITTGIAEGLQDATAMSTLRTKIRAVVAEALAEAQRASEQGSPSRLFADEVGSPIGQGIAMGIANSSSEVKNSIGNMIRSNSRYRPDISNVALAGAYERLANITTNTTNNYNLGVNTNQTPQVVQRSFAVMKAFKGD